MFIPQSYSLAVVLCIVTMLCWGSWGNTQKLAGKSWRFELFYWDYVIGILLFSLLLGFTLGSSGENGRKFLTDISQAESGKHSESSAGRSNFQCFKHPSCRSHGYCRDGCCLPGWCWHCPCTWRSD